MLERREGWGRKARASETGHSKESGAVGSALETSLDLGLSSASSPPVRRGPLWLCVFEVSECEHPQAEERRRWRC